MFDYVGNAPVEVGENLLRRFGQLVFAVVDVVLFQQLKDTHLAGIHRVILPAVPDLVSQFQFDVAHYEDNGRAAPPEHEAIFNAPLKGGKKKEKVRIR